jgi:hypothetical protein
MATRLPSLPRFAPEVDVVVDLGAEVLAAAEEEVAAWVMGPVVLDALVGALVAAVDHGLVVDAL